MPQHYVNLTLTDYSNESSPLKVFHGAVTAASIGGYLTDLGTFRTATDNFTLGTIEKEQWVGDNTLISNIPPTDPDAQRERKGLVIYVGNISSKLYTLTIPTIARTRQMTITMYGLAMANRDIRPPHGARGRGAPCTTGRARRIRRSSPTTACRR